jgi:hypothetical protein
MLQFIIVQSLFKSYVMFQNKMTQSAAINSHIYFTIISLSLLIPIWADNTEQNHFAASLQSEHELRH